MSTHKIIKELLDENLIGAKKEIEDILYEKLGEHLNEMYTEIAPSLLDEGKKKKKKEKMDPVGEEDDDVDNDGDSDESDNYIKKRRAAIEKAVSKRKKTNEDADPGVLAPGVAPTDEPGDISKKKNKEKKDAVVASGSNMGTGEY